MTTDEIKAALERAEKATLGPWELMGFDESQTWIRPPAGEENALICTVSVGLKRPQGAANGEFIAAARTDVPALCRDLLAAREALAKLLREVEKSGNAEAKDFGWPAAVAAARAALEAK